MNVEGEILFIREFYLNGEGIEMHLNRIVLKLINNVQSINIKTKFVHELFLKCSKNYSSSSYKIILRKPIINQPRIMKLESPQFKSCLTPEVMMLKDLFGNIGHEIRIVGGAVRDLLMGILPKDLDFASTATPEEMKNMFNQNQIRMINTNGERHGTITSRINEQNFEVTTLRVDLATNGRHAEVEFTRDWALDANRRDLTINAMYLGLDGTIYDYFNGYEDLKNKRLVFVGDAAARIQEDYLRILRYFRFYGVISDGPDKHVEDVLKAIRENAEGLGNISGERIWVELSKILMGKFVFEIIMKMISLGVGSYIGFPKNCNEVEFKTVCDRIKMKDSTAHPMTYLTALFDNEEDLNEFFLRLKHSTADKELALFVFEHRKKTCSDSLKPYKVLAFSAKLNLIRELLKYQGKFDLLEELDEWKIPKFPVNGHMLKEIGITGPAIGVVLSELKHIWYENNFNSSAEELLNQAPKIPIPTISEQPIRKRRR